MPDEALASSTRPSTVRSARSRSASSFCFLASSSSGRGTGSIRLRTIRFANRCRAAIAAAVTPASRRGGAVGGEAPGGELVEHDAARANHAVEDARDIVGHGSRRDRQREIETARTLGRVRHRLPFGQIAHREAQMIAADLFGVERGGERRVALTARQLHGGECRTRFRGERMRAAEDALALGQGLRQADAGLRHVAGAHLQRAAQLEHAGEVIGLVGGS